MITWKTCLGVSVIDGDGQRAQAKVIDGFCHPGLEGQTELSFADSYLDGDFPNGGSAQEKIILPIGDGGVGGLAE